MLTRSSSIASHSLDGTANKTGLLAKGQNYTLEPTSNRRLNSRRQLEFGHLGFVREIVHHEHVPS